MEPINHELFYSEFEKIEELFNKLRNLKSIHSFGSNDEGYSFNSKGITLKTSTYFSGCGTEDFSFTIEWLDINRPIEWWQDKFNAEIEDVKRRKIKSEKDDEIRKRSDELKLLESLKKKYEKY